MKRDFLRELGVEEEAVKAILDQHMLEINAAKPEDYDTLKQSNDELQSKISEYEKQVTTLSEEVTKASEQVSALSTENNTFKLKDLKSNILREHNLPLNVLDNILGEDEETIRKSAENLASIFKETKPTQPMKSYEAPEIDTKDLGLRQLVRNLTNEGE